MATFDLRVRYSETGAEGFAYHANYYSWFDMVQTQFLEENGLSYQEIAEKGVHFLPIDVKSRYHAPVYFGDTLTVEMKVEALSNVKTTLSYRVTRKSDQASIVQCRITYACMSRDFRPLVLKNALPALYRALQSELDKA